jgi:hypothetical protein
MYRSRIKLAHPNLEYLRPIPIKQVLAVIPNKRASSHEQSRTPDHKETEYFSIASNES